MKYAVYSRSVERWEYCGPLLSTRAKAEEKAAALAGLLRCEVSIQEVQE